MKINWKLRLQSKYFWVALISLIVLLTQQLGFDIFPKNWEEVLNTVLSILILLGVINDPTTAGLNDSEQALDYLVPKGK
ncbi:phage holin [Streptococcus uberis]|uniref:phage holin n=1 Tax=Streptococcus uberis TaxID=1349 RepID=UPI001FF17901|nr:phage holin [Streptococcus uberis]MCK1213182.1 phage holin [Streptococcus uberis]MCK1224949.1 phage holin [Streptococcus uberis]MCK1239097.1 phage holin [Streptococcus uberis]MCK1242364.1 phage holin [Streptococcus uberis]